MNKKEYNGLYAKKINFNRKSINTGQFFEDNTQSGCWLIVANKVEGGMQTCSNPVDTTVHIYYRPKRRGWD